MTNTTPLTLYVNALQMHLQDYKVEGMVVRHIPWKAEVLVRDKNGKVLLALPMESPKGTCPRGKTTAWVQEWGRRWAKKFKRELAARKTAK